MIKNEQQYRITQERADEFRREIAELEQEQVSRKLHPKLRQARADALRSQLETLKRELREYEDIDVSKVKTILSLAESLRFKWGPPLSESEIDDYERKIGLSFPRAYREFLRSFGNLTKGEGILGSPRNNSLTQQPSVVDQTKKLRKEYPETFPKSVVAVLPGGDGNYWCLVCTGPDIGKVVFWQHDLAPESTYPNDPPGESGFWIESDNFLMWLSEILEESVTAERATA